MVGWASQVWTWKAIQSKELQGINSSQLLAICSSILKLPAATHQATHHPIL